MKQIVLSKIYFSRSYIRLSITSSTLKTCIGLQILVLDEAVVSMIVKPEL